MPRRAGVPKRDVLPDPKFNSKVVTKLINQVMYDGKKSTASFGHKKNSHPKGWLFSLLQVLRSSFHFAPNYRQSPLDRGSPEQHLRRNVHLRQTLDIIQLRNPFILAADTGACDRRQQLRFCQRVNIPWNSRLRAHLTRPCIPADRQRSSAGSPHRQGRRPIRQ